MTQIVLFGAGHCMPCRKTKAYLESKGKEYTYLDVTVEENAEKLKSYGVNSIPFIVKGDITISGYNPEALDKL